jgi:hypothetical protein
MNSGHVAVGLVAVLLFSAVGGVFVGSVGAATGAGIEVSDPGVGVITQHNVTATVDGTSSGEDGSSLGGLLIDYASSSSGSKVNLTGVTKESIVAVGVDRDNDGVIEDDSPVNSIGISENGTRMNVDLGGPSNLDGGEEVVIRFTDVGSPGTEGEYSATVEINPQSSSEAATGTYNVTDTEITDVRFEQGPNGPQDLDVVVDANDQLDTLDVDISDDAMRSLTSTEFNESGSGDSWTYTADASKGEDGDFTATVTAAADTNGFAARTVGQSASTTVDTIGIAVDGGNVTPSTVDAGETEAQTVDVRVSGASADGEDETVSIALDDTLTVADATATVTNSTASSASVQRVTNDSSNTTVVAAVDSTDGGGTAAYNVTFDLNVSYPAGVEGDSFGVNASATDSDGDSDGPRSVTAVGVRSVPPEITNFTLIRTGQDVDLELNTTEELGSGTVNLTGDAGGELSITNAELVEDNGATWRYVLNVSNGMDGDFAANVSGEGTNYYVADTVGNQNPDPHNDSIGVNQDNITVVDANITSATPLPGETVDQSITVDVSKVSLDGQPDTVQVVMPSAAESVTLTGTGTNATDSSTTTVDGATAFSATVNPGDGGGVTSVQVTFGVNATYPNATEGDLLELNASAFDSDGDTDTATNVTQVAVQDTVPQISNFTLYQSPAGSQDVDLRFNASEQLDTATVDFQNDRSGESRTLAGNLTETANADGTYTYTGNVSEGVDGQFNATLTAADAAGNDAQGDRDASLRVNETDPVVVDATVEPNATDPGTTVVQNLTATVDGFSRDASTDEVRVTFPTGVTVESTSGLTVTDNEGGSATGSGVADPDNRTVVVSVDSGDGLGTANVTAAFDATITYGDALEGETVPLNVTAVDSDGATDATTNETNVRVRDTQPVISNFTLENTTNGVDLTFDSTEALNTIAVDLRGDVETARTLNRGNVTESGSVGNYTYTAENVATADGTYNATLAAGAARDSDDNGNPSSHESSATRNRNGIDVVAANVTAEPVDPQSTVDQQATVDVENVSLDGSADTVDVTVNDSVDATATNVTSTVGSASLSDADNLTATVQTGSGGGVADLTLTYTVTATYADSLEGETLAVDASATDSDGDSDTETALTNVSVRDTHPQITNFTLRNESQNVDLSFDSSEVLDSVTVDLTADAGGTLTVGDFDSTEIGGNYSYEANVSDGVDGTFNATLQAGDAEDNAGNSNNESHSANRTVDTRDVPILSANVTPETVDPETTVEQEFTVSADNFDRGGDDTLTLTLNNSLNVTGVAGETVTAGDATATGATTVDTDSEGEAERVRISLDTGSGAGTVDVTAAVNSTVAYPAGVEGEVLAVDVGATDSDGSSDAATALTNVTVDDVPPTITNFSLNATRQDVDVSFTANEQLSTTEVDLGGNLNRTLSDLTESQVGTEEWRYTGNVSDGQDGYFTATLSNAVDRFGNDGADGESDTIRVNTVGPKIQQTRISPDALLPGERTNQTLTTNVTGLSADGVNDSVSYEFGNESTITLDNVTAEGANASAVVTDNATAVVVNVSTGNTSGSANVTLSTNLTAAYDNSTEGETVNVTALVNDSLNETAGPLNTTVAVNDTVPNVTVFNLTADGQAVNLTVETNESLATLNVTLGGDLNETLTRGNFTENTSAGNYSYTANVSEGFDGNFTATLTNATDPFGNNATVGQNDSLVVDTVNVSLAGNVTPSEIRPNATIEGTALLNASDLRLDGINDTATVTFGSETDVLAANASVDDANATAVVADVSDADLDGLNETIDVTINTTDNLGTGNVSIVLNTTAYYNGSLEGTNVTVDGVLNDSAGSSDTATTNVTVVDTVPPIEAFDVTLNGSAVVLTVRSNESLESVRVALSGATGGNLTRADFDASRDGEWVTYDTTLAEGREGTFGAELVVAADGHGNDGAAGQNDSVTVRFGGGGGGGGQQGVQQPTENETSKNATNENITRVDNATGGPALSVRVTSTDAARKVVVENARPGAEVAAHLTATDAEAAAGVRLSDVGLTTGGNGTVTLAVRSGTSTAAFESLPEDVDTVMTYRIVGERVEDTGYTLRVDDSRLGERSRESLRVFDAAGNELNVSYQGETAERHGFRVDTDADRFAVALTGANVSIVDASLPTADGNGTVEDVDADTVFVNATLRNTGSVAGNRTVTVTAANEPVAERTVSVAADSTRTVQLIADADVDREGPILLEANEVEAGTIPPADERSTSEPNSTSTTADSPFALATLLVAIAGAALLARRE